MTEHDERTPDIPTNTQYKVMCAGYKWALGMIPGASGKSVLDCACGRGYGSYILASGAGHVTGVDISAETIAYCRGRYAGANLDFGVMDACALDFPDGVFDAVVSQDTVEHVKDDSRFMSEMSRVLKADGVLIVFTPRAKAHDLRPDNPYHLREYSPESFRVLAGKYFGSVEYYGRRLSPGLARLESDLSAVRGLDIFGLRRMLPVGLRHRLASLLAGLRGNKTLEEVTLEDLEFSPGLGDSPTIIAVCRKR